MFDIYANTQDSDLGSVARQVQKIVDDVKQHLPRGTTVVMRGQVQSMNSSYVGLGVGIAFAILFVYLLMAVNFQSWLVPFIIIVALPGALTGIVWMLFITRTPISVPALMGAIMCIGVATSNSILMVTFANEQLRYEGKDSFGAALAAGFTRLRPVLMTALAMILGMLPMSLGLGDGGEAKRPPWARRNRWPAGSDLLCSVLRSDRLQIAQAKLQTAGIASASALALGRESRGGVFATGRFANHNSLYLIMNTPPTKSENPEAGASAGTKRRNGASGSQDPSVRDGLAQSASSWQGQSLLLR